MTNEQAKATHEEWHAAKGGPPITIYAYHEASDGTRHVYNVAHVFTQVAAKRIANLPALEASHAALLRELVDLEAAADDANATWGERDKLCIFCGANRYTGTVGIAHNNLCQILKARAAIQRATPT